MDTSHFAHTAYVTLYQPDEEGRDKNFDHWEGTRMTNFFEIAVEYDAGRLPNFLTSFLSLLSFLSASTSMQGMPLALASSQWEASPNTHTLSFGRGM